jgi:GDP-L-fucose synthase
VRIAVTGGTGFLGRHVVRALNASGYTDVFPVSRSMGYDLMSPLHRNDVLAQDTDVVIHLAAAVGGIGANVASSGRFMYENLIMGAELMDLARRRNVRKFITIGTACEYPENAPVPLSERDIWGGYPVPDTAPYGLAKRTLLAMGQAYREEYGFNATHLLLTNLYGPEDNFDGITGHVIPSLIQRFSDAQARADRSVICWGTGRATRDFLYVTDAARAIVQAMELYDSREPLNIGSGTGTSIEFVAHLIAEYCGFTGEIQWDASKPEGSPGRHMDVTRAKDYLGFSPRVPLTTGIPATVAWFNQNLA